MPRIPRTLCALLLGALLLPRAAQAQFQAIETKDLRLVYPHPIFDFLAPYTARCFENSLNVHRRLWGVGPSEKVNVMMDDLSDFGNAGVWMNPRNNMVVHIAPSNSVYETEPSNERINSTMHHEMVHVLALDVPAGSDRLFRSLFAGKVRESDEHPESMLYSYLTLPRRAAPRWYHEGMAVFIETWMAGGLGRAQGPYDEMVFRSMVRDSAHFFDPLGLESEGTRIDFQVGVNSYLYGTRFVTWLAYRYSPEQVMDWLARKEGSRAYFASQFRHVFGHSLNDAWSDWIAFEHEFQRANLDSLRRFPTTPYRDLSTMALGSVSRAFVDSVSSTLIAAVYHPGSVAQLAAVPLAGGPPRTLHEIKGPALYFVSSLAFDPDRRQLFFTTDNSAWRDLCVYDLASGRVRKLISDARIGDLAFDRSSGVLWAVRHFNGISSIVRLEPPYRNWRRIWSLPYGLDAVDLDVSPDGRTLAASFAEISGRETLRLLDVATLAAGDTTTRTLWDFGHAIPSGFVFSPDGGTLVGSSYYTGVSNIFRYDLARDSMDIVTNAETGYFRPVPTRDDSLIVFRYSGRGFTPARILPRPLTDVSATTFLGERLVEKHPVLKTWIAPPPSAVTLDSAVVSGHPYPALASVRLNTIYPIIEVYREHVSMGWNAEFADPLAFHQFAASVTVAPQPDLPADERLHVSARYRRYDITVLGRYNPASFYDLFGPVKTSRKGYGTEVDWRRLLVLDKPRMLELTAYGSHWGGLERLPDQQNVSVSNDFDQLLSFGTELRYKNMRSSIGAADFEVGHQWWVGGDVNNVRFARGGGREWRSFPFLQGGLDAGRQMPRLRNSSLWVRTAAGLASAERGEPFANYYFGGFGNNWIDNGEPKRYRDSDRFPGTELDAVQGTNYARAMLDWNLPALRFRRAGTLALYASWLRVSIFGGGLVTNFDDAGSRRELANVGAQADLRMQFLTQMPLTLSLGWANAAERHGGTSREWMLSLKVL